MVSVERISSGFQDAEYVELSFIPANDMSWAEEYTSPEFADVARTQLAGRYTFKGGCLTLFYRGKFTRFKVRSVGSTSTVPVTASSQHSQHFNESVSPRVQSSDTEMATKSVLLCIHFTSESKWGFSVSLREDNICVTNVQELSQASKLGVHVGDLVVRVGDILVNDNLEGAVALMKRGGTIEFLLNRHVSIADDNSAIDHEIRDTLIYPFRLINSTRVRVTSFGSFNSIESDSKGHGVAVGGLDHHVKIVRSMIELPLLRPELFESYGVRPPTGVLLVGPPGTGKTLIARSCAEASGAHITIINGSEIMSKFYGETERRLRLIFEGARRQAPALIVIDEIDALCPRRNTAGSELEKRTVATLLTLMDGSNAIHNIKKPTRVMILGTTNCPDALDPAVRRPGRFDRELEIGVPNASERHSILSILLSQMTTTVNDKELADVAAATHGYVGADLSALCNEAGLISIQRSVAGENDANTKPVAISIDDLWAGVKLIRPSAMREVLIDIPKVRWEDIGGQSDVKQKLRECVEWPLQHGNAFSRMGIRPPRGVMLYGPPGCSKTLMAKALATESGLNFITVKGPELFSKWVGESEKAVRDVFRKARAASPSVVFFDEIDALAAQRRGGGVGERVLAQLLSEMDGVQGLSNVTIVAATNRPDLVDNALLRPGRIDRMIYVGPPDYEARLQILRIEMAKLGDCGTNIDFGALARRTQGHSGAEIVAICKQAILFALRGSHSGSDISLCEKHFSAALDKVTKTIDDSMTDFYMKYQGLCER